MCPTFEWHSVAAILQSCDISNVSHIGMAWCGSHYKISHVIFQCIPHLYGVSATVVSLVILAVYPHWNGMVWQPLQDQSCGFPMYPTFEWHGVGDSQDQFIVIYRILQMLFERLLLGP